MITKNGMFKELISIVSITRVLLIKLSWSFRFLRLAARINRMELIGREKKKKREAQTFGVSCSSFRIGVNKQRRTMEVSTLWSERGWHVYISTKIPIKSLFRFLFESVIRMSCGDRCLENCWSCSDWNRILFLYRFTSIILFLDSDIEIFSFVFFIFMFILLLIN